MAMTLAAPWNGQAQAKISCQIEYTDMNQIDYGPLALSSKGGIAMDPDGVLVPGVCVGLFKEKDHQLIASEKTNDAGHFEFSGVPTGEYRLVTSADGFPPANAKVRIASGFDHKPLIIHLIPGAIDTTSYVDLKKSKH